MLVIEAQRLWSCQDPGEEVQAPNSIICSLCVSSAQLIRTSLKKLASILMILWSQ
jgi:hypothetical protein